MVVTVGTKAWSYQVSSFNVAQLKINSDHLAQTHQKKDIQKLLQEIQNLSMWKRTQLDNGYKHITFVAQEVHAEELKEMFSKEYVPWKSICQTQRTHKNQYAVVQDRRNPVRLDVNKTPLHCIHM